MMKNMRKELDEVKNAIKGKIAVNLDGMINRTDSPFTVSVLEVTTNTTQVTRVSQLVKGQPAKGSEGCLTTIKKKKKLIQFQCFMLATSCSPLRFTPLSKATKCTIHYSMN